VSAHPTISAADAPPLETGLEGRATPAWLLSIVLHTTVLVALGLTYRSQFVGAADEEARTTGIALVRGSDESQPSYFSGEQESGGPTAAASAGRETSNSPMVFTLPREADLAIGPESVLPKGTGEGSLGVLSGEGIPGAADLTQGGTGTGRGPGSGFGEGHTYVFGVKGTGTKFLYVFDRSGSMEGYEGRPLAAAKAQLVRSLADLKSTHQFQIIFYNERPTVFSLRGGPPAMAFGDENSKAAATRFVEGMTAAGGTSHLDALLMALRLAPDVVFFLTDADDPVLTADEMAKVRRANRGSAIHAIEFGYGPQRSGENFLMRLARENGGQHAYVDIARLPRP